MFKAPAARKRSRRGGSADRQRRANGSEDVSLGPWTLRLLDAQQARPHHEQVRQRGGHHKPMPVLGQAAVADLGELEHAFDYANRMLDSDAHAGFPPIRRAQLWRRRATMNEVAGVGRAYAERARLSRVRRVAP